MARQHPQWLAGAVLVDANIPEYFTVNAIERGVALYAPVIAKIKEAPSTPATRQLLALSDSFRETFLAFHKASWPQSVPAMVIVAEKTPFEDPIDAQWWRDSHAQFAKAAENRQLIIAEHSSHDVVKDRPDVIIKAVTDLIARSPKAPQPAKK
jgi:pimeloyl-ACP methyl ester carboxylesterase